jgi:predicted nucleic acid-binding Zn ribbon protein
MLMAIEADRPLHPAYSSSRLWCESAVNLLQSLPDVPLTAGLRIHAATSIERCLLISIDILHMAIEADRPLHPAYSSSRLLCEAATNLLQSLPDVPLTAGLQIHAATSIERCRLVSIDVLHMAIEADRRLHHAYSSSRLWCEAAANLLRSLPYVPLTFGLQIHAVARLRDVY